MRSVMSKWSVWRSFPDPREGGYLNAPFGPGVYQIRNRLTAEMVLFGRGANCAARMTSLLPKPLGTGTRNNTAKRDYVLSHLKDLEYRCFPCTSSRHAE